MFSVSYLVLIFTFLFFYCDALNCKSDGGPKEEELKNIYMTCLKRHDGRNNSNRNSDNWNQQKGYNQKSQWDSERNRGERNNREDRNNRDDRYNEDRMSNDRKYEMRNDNNNGRMNGRYGKMGSEMNRRSDMMGTGYERTNINGREDFDQSNEFGGDMSYSYGSSTQAPRRYKKDTRAKMNSGQRSQYNPNVPSSSKSSYDSYRNDKDSNRNNSKKEMERKACALHCFMEHLEMTGDDDMPDRYLVTHALTKSVRNEDLRDFLQESVEECFQILDNENTEDKCEFSKNLLMCLSEKGKANCDDWKEDMQF